MAGLAIGTGWLLLAKRGDAPLPFKTSCPVVSSAELNSVNRTLDRPVNPRLESLVRKANHVPQSEQSFINEETMVRQFIDEQAAKDGFTLVDDAPYRSKLLQTASIPKKLEILNQFTENYGFKVTTAPNFNTLDANKFKSTKDVLAEDFTGGASSLMEIFHYLPVEIAKYSNIHEIRIVSDIPGDKEASAGPEGTIHMTYGSFVGGNYTIYMHELGHLVDFTECGDDNFFSQQDHQYLGLNPKKFKYGNQTRWSWVGITASPYGGTEVKEDKAEVYKNMLNGLNPLYFNSPYHVLKEKYRLLLARLDTQIPGIANYLASISVRRANEMVAIDSQLEQAAPGILKTENVRG